MRVFLGLASVLVGLVVVAVLAKSQLQALGSHTARTGSAAPAGAAEPAPRRAAAAVTDDSSGGGSRVGQGAAGTSLAAPQQAREATLRALQQGAERNATEPQ